MWAVELMTRLLKWWWKGRVEAVLKLSIDSGEDDCCSSLSAVHYETRNQTQWLNGFYMDLRMRSNPLFNSEASHALHQHFHHDEKTDAALTSSSVFDDSLSRHNSLHRAQAESYGISGLVVFDKSMFGQLDGSSFTERFGHLVTGFNSGSSCFMDEPFC
ncbi:hypothetical protein AXG93_1052s1290 [Marchantia polymorpha subsp. ruderalis]|uniref:Uncharacterized protein n=1 Tax=Marchantia polymorpha subsp. ruderalis TaxID=1480154 RepID=A0A176VWP8_MARPO|nr:hypothetical protein AXG93_1052s1290 [Marchantia polymorpha subsp. ruderalis]